MKCLKGVLRAAIALAFCVTGAYATEYPDRPIGVVVSYSAGGATDFQARIATMEAANADYLGQPIYIINKPGSGGRKGWNWFATQVEADGYLISAYNIPHFIAQSIMGGVKYSIDSFEPIANWGADPAVVIVGKDSEFNTMDDLIAFATANPAKTTMSGAGLYVGHHIAALQIEKACGCKLAYTPTIGGGVAAINAVIAGDVMAGINNLSDAYRAREAGRVKILGVADLQRSELISDVPTLKETGLDVDNASVNFRGLMVPKGTPPAIIAKLANQVPAMFENTRVIKQMKAGGSPMKIMNRKEVKKMWANRQKKLTLLLGQL